MECHRKHLLTDISMHGRRPGEAAGLATGDLVLCYNGQSVTSKSDFMAANAAVKVYDM